MVLESSSLERISMCRARVMPLKLVSCCWWRIPGLHCQPYTDAVCFFRSCSVSLAFSSGTILRRRAEKPSRSL